MAIDPQKMSIYRIIIMALMALSVVFFGFGFFWKSKSPQVEISHKKLQFIEQPNSKLLPKTQAISLSQYDTDVFNPQNIVPDSGQLSIGVFGDSMADGVWAGLYREIANQTKLYQFSKQATGLANYNYFDTALEAKKKIEETKINIAIIVIGTNDQTGVIGRGNIAGFGAPNWEKAYHARTIELIEIFKEKKIAVYWVGLPIMRDQEPQASARYFGKIFSNCAKETQTSFIDTSKATAGKDGNYSDFLSLPNSTDLKLLRNSDGIHFKMEGYRLMALPVISAINRDIKNPKIQLLPKSLQKSANQTTIKK